ncbi:MAG: hypothetical protein IPM50_09270 [Acidobacteriota bacterium]|nr:MAG: hypothetical protein IPM50_09270 [Acidobacteriota bacterium]
MPATRKKTFNRGKAIAAVQICWKQISPDGDRDERLAWISEFLDREVFSLKDLTDEQLGAVAGEMKRLTGQTAAARSKPARPVTSVSGNVVAGNFGRGETRPDRSQDDRESQTVFLASDEQVYTLDKLDAYIGWPSDDRAKFLTKRFKTTNFRRLTFKQATSATNMLLHIAAHKDLKRRSGADQPVSRTEINKYIPKLKSILSIDR